MSSSAFFPHLRGIRLLSSQKENTRLILTCERVTRPAVCPVCGTAAHRVQSRYARTVKDLSVQTRQIILHLHVRTFYCDQPICLRRLFAERLPHVTSSHGRSTFGLRHFLGQLGREPGGAAGERLANLLGIRVRARAVLRFLHALALPTVITPHVIGLDDWAWKRREREGAIVVDLERNRPIALLPDRSQKTVVPWLKRYPTINSVARDRSQKFAAAMTEALPHAKHVADRWHLAKNGTESLENVVSRRWKQRTEGVDEAASELPPEPVPVSSLALRPRQPAGEARSQQVLALQKAGFSTGTIAKRLGGGQRTIPRWLAQEHSADAGPRKPRRSPLDWSTKYLRERWEAGEHNGTLLWEE